MSMWQGWHGTSALSGNQIIASTFRKSQAVKDWLGNGAYFFIEDNGHSDPIVKAEEWAVLRSNSARNYSRYSVLRAEIEAETCLDFDDPAHIGALNELRNAYSEFLRNHGRRPSGEFLLDKCNFCNFLIEEHEVEALIKREYIKTTQDELDFGVHAGIPNCRIMCVSNPDASVRKIDYAVERRNVQ